MAGRGHQFVKPLINFIALGKVGDFGAHASVDVKNDGRDVVSHACGIVLMELDSEVIPGQQQGFRS